MSSFKFTNPVVSAITLQNSQAGPVRQTVTNVSPHILQTLAFIETTVPAAKDWIRIEPDAPTPIMNGATAHFDLFITVPTTVTTAQTITFQLVVADERHPEDDFSRSADMTFTTSVQPKRPAWIIPLVVLIVIALVAVGVGAFVLSRPKPDPTPSGTITFNATPVTSTPTLIPPTATLIPTFTNFRTPPPG